jgi:hypothetical protein
MSDIEKPISPPCREQQIVGPWRDPIADPPTMTGKILVWVDGTGPLLVNVEERWMSYWNGYDETEPACPDEWNAWAEIRRPNSTDHPTN